MIIASAIRVTKDDKVFVIMGKRHNNCFETMYDAGVRRPFTEEQGFVTDKFEFLDRYDAMEHAKSEYQVTDNLIGQLYSEDIWREGVDHE